MITIFRKKEKICLCRIENGINAKVNQGFCPKHAEEFVKSIVYL